MSVKSQEEVKKLYLPPSEIKKIEDEEKEAKLFDFKYQDIVPKHMFRMYISGPSQSGKSWFLYYMLIKYYKGYFDKIHIFSPTFGMDQSAQTFKRIYDSKRILRESYNVYDDLDLKKIEQILEENKRKVSASGVYRAPKILIILDDLITSKLMKSPLMKTLFFRGRHYGVSLVLTSQSYMALDRNLRLNCTALAIFSPTESEIKRFSDEQQSALISSKKLASLLHHCSRERYCFLFINRNDKPNEQYRKNLDEVIDIQNM